MSHHLTRDQHREVHRAHIERDGMHSSRQLPLVVPLANLHGVEHELVVRTHDLRQHHRASAAGVNMTVEVCVQCGIVERIVCDHGMSFWTHRVGCPKHDPSLPIVWSMYRPTWDAGVDAGPPDESCDGCLLVCPICKADGT